MVRLKDFDNDMKVVFVWLSLADVDEVSVEVFVALDAAAAPPHEHTTMISPMHRTRDDKPIM